MKKAEVMWGVLQRRLGVEVFHTENEGTISLLSDCKAIAEAKHIHLVQWVHLWENTGDLRRLTGGKLTAIFLNALVPKLKGWWNNTQTDQKEAKQT